jgi:hypothetical protein
MFFFSFEMSLYSQERKIQANTRIERYSTDRVGKNQARHGSAVEEEPV